MEHSNSGPTPQGKPLEDALAEFLESKSGNYATNLERVVGQWITYCADRDVRTLESVTKRTMGHYASHLDRRVDAGQSDAVDGGIAASTAWTYYNQVSAFLSWAVKWDYLAENPAEKAVAKDELPPRPSSSDSERQFWSPDQRQALVSYVDNRARTAIDERGVDALEEVRDRALVTLLAYTGVRGAEVLADYRDDRRNGLRWHNVHLDDGVITVLGKSQQTEQTPLPDQAVEPLRRLETILDPPAEGWPVFPSRHPPSLYKAIDAAGHEKPDGDPWEYVLETGIEPPSMSTSGARTLLKRLSDKADVPLDDSPKDYLTLHGARRGVGEKLYRERGAAAAQRTLRHADPQTTSEMYSHIEASELAKDNTAVFDDE
ncbi:integrase family protein [Natrialba hulunbeirensis JCM 10989]|uniref:Integrase family protein n=1 Tax=Natrialba hulunbeirensis JCM 10989 TaxID=1227493 RepID=M0ACH8_9EURY|nr:site-specific integrase [Natrialba hulunbeirensis]ELY96086.1 integrase family protein [Natrialba hulunbeirensis JCM 10989]